MTITEITPTSDSSDSSHSSDCHGAPDRWQPTRAGLVNIWNYDDELLEFENGRLLLTGGNGAGKTMALELLLPFLLDGDARPWRLSTAGGTDRGGLWGRAAGNATQRRIGYLWVEFGRRGPDGHTDYFTCGDRLTIRAHGDGGTHTYFTTTQRVGDGLRLLDDTRRPLTADAFNAAIGDHGTVTEDRTIYSNTVRTTIYPDHSPEEYESMIDSLLTVRKQSVTDDLNPAKLSALLTDGLPGLDDKEISDIAGVFEQLDARRDQIDELNEFVDASSALAKLATTYARNALGYAAGLTADAQKELTTCVQAHAAAQTAVTETTAALTAAERDLTANNDERKKLGEKYRTLLASPEGRRIDEIRRAEQAAKGGNEIATRSENNAADLADDAANASQNAESKAQKADEAERKLTSAITALTSACNDAGVIIAASQSPSDLISDSRLTARHRKAAVEEVQGLVTDDQQAQADLASKADALHDAETDVEERSSHVTVCSDKLANEQASWASEVITWAGTVTELGVTDANDPFHDDVCSAASSHDPEAVRTVVSQAGRRAAASLAAETQRATAAQQATVDDLQATEAEIEKLSAEDHTVTPDRQPWRNSHDPDIAGAPLWQLLAPVDGLDQSRLDGIEAGLLGAGILDAWVTVNGTLPAHGDVLALAHAAAEGATLASFLRVDLDAANAAGIDPEHVTAILNAIGFENDAARLSVAGDGTFMYGVAVGAVDVTGAKHIGAAARERARQAKLADLEQARVALVATLEEQQAEIDQLRERERIVDRETSEVPSSEGIATAIRHLSQAQTLLDDAEQRLAVVRHALAEATSHADATRVRLAQVAGGHSLPTTAAALASVDDALDNVTDTAHIAEGAVERSDLARTAADEASTEAARKQVRAEEAGVAAASDRQRADEARVAYETMKASHGDDAEEAAAKIKQVDEDLTRLNTAHDELTKAQTNYSKQQGAVEGELKQAAMALSHAEAALVDLQAWFTAVLNSGLSTDAGLDCSAFDLTTDEGFRKAVRLARRTLPSSSPDELTSDRANLRGGQITAQQRLGSSVGFNAPPVPLPDGVSAPIELISLDATLDSVVRRIPEMAKEFEANLTQLQDELSESDRERFTSVIAGSLRNHIASRYRAATKLVDSMNAIISDIETEQGNVGVSLRWEVKDLDEDNATLKRITNLLLRSSHSDQERTELQDFFQRRLDRIRDTDNPNASWEEDLRDLFDYRKWHAFKIMVRHQRFGDTPVPVTSRKVSLSAGETALVTSLPLFAAIASHYMPRDTGSPEPQCPRLLLLDEVFPKNDTKNKRQILKLLTTLDLDCVMTSDKDRCTYDTIDGIAIALIAKDGDHSYSTRFVWNGVEEIQEDPKDLSGDPWQPSLH